jgi:hypothetical protein
MAPERILPAQFMHITKEVRDYIAAMWKIPQSGITEVRDQYVISDGHTYEDLAVITLDKMCEYIGSRETFARAWELTCAKAYSELYPPEKMIVGKEEPVKDAPEPVIEEKPDPAVVGSKSKTSKAPQM